MDEEFEMEIEMSEGDRAGEDLAAAVKKSRRARTRCSNQMCGGEDCENCHPMNFRNGVYIGDDNEVAIQIDPLDSVAALHSMVTPFAQWGDRYFGLSVQDGKVTTEPDQDKNWTEYHLEYRGGDVWEIEVCPTEDTGWTVWRGKIPNRETFATIMQYIEEAPPIDWANENLSHA